MIPSAGRAEVLAGTLEVLNAEAPPGYEAVVALEGDDPASEQVIAAAGAKLVRVPAGTGPGAARNRAIAQSRSELCLLCDDDVRPVPGSISAHIAAHAADPDPMLAIMGLVVPAPPLDRSRFQRWLHEGGIQFGYGALQPGEIEGRYLWVANASFKRSGLEKIGGFDEAIGFGSEDADLGIRFGDAGGRIVYRDDIVGLHWRPTTLEQTLARMRRVGVASSEHPGSLRRQTEPRPTGIGHRAAIGALTAIDAAGLLRGPLEAGAWRALCKQAYREAYWRESDDGLALGGRLARRLGARMASSDPSAG